MRGANALLHMRVFNRLWRCAMTAGSDEVSVSKADPCG